MSDGMWFCCYVLNSTLASCFTKLSTSDSWQTEGKKGICAWTSIRTELEFLMAMALYSDSRHFLSTILTAECRPSPCPIRNTKGQRFWYNSLCHSYHHIPCHSSSMAKVKAGQQQEHPNPHLLNLSTCRPFPCHSQQLKETEVCLTISINHCIPGLKSSELSSQKAGEGGTGLTERPAGRQADWEKQSSHFEGRTREANAPLT